MSDLSLILQYALAAVLVLLALLSAQLVVLGFCRLFKPALALRRPHLPDEALPDVLVPVLTKSYETFATPYSVTLGVSAKAGVAISDAATRQLNLNLDMLYSYGMKVESKK